MHIYILQQCIFKNFFITEYIFEKVLLKVLYYEFHKITLMQAKVIYLILDTIAIMIGLILVDSIMENVNASNLAIFVVSFVRAFLGIKDIEEKVK